MPSARFVAERDTFARRIAHTHVMVDESVGSGIIPIRGLMRFLRTPSRATFLLIYTFERHRGAAFPPVFAIQRLLLHERTRVMKNLYIFEIELRRCGKILL